MARGFNRDMEKYLKGRKDSRLSFRFKGKKKVEQVPEVNDEGVTIEDRPSFWDRFFKNKKQIPTEDLTEEEQERLEAMEEEIEAVDKMETADPENAEIYEEARESLIERFFQNLRLFRHKHELRDEEEAVLDAEEELEEEKAHIDEDVKEVLKITHKWLGKLSKRNREAFIESDDYKKYKDILQEHGLAKK